MIMLSLFSECRDLKRDVAKKLEKLERRTQRAIAELIREYSHLLFVHPLFQTPAISLSAPTGIYEASCLVASILLWGL